MMGIKIKAISVIFSNLMPTRAEGSLLLTNKLAVEA